MNDWCLIEFVGGVNEFVVPDNLTLSFVYLIRF